MNRHLTKTIQLYQSYGVDFNELLIWHLEHGIVVCNNDVFAMGFYSHNLDIMVSVPHKEANTFYGTILAGNMKTFLKTIKDNFEFVSFQRSFKNSHKIRIYNMNKFFNKLK